MRIRAKMALLAVCVAACASLGCTRQELPPLKLLGIWHKVEDGDTVASVAKRYGADPDALAELNDLPPDGSLSGLSEIFVPKSGGRPPGTGAPPSANRETVAAAKNQNCTTSGRKCLEWPVRGTVSAGFGVRSGRQHDGIDIPAEAGSPAVAADKGRVLYSGDAIKGYGNLIIVRHDKGIITVYAHNQQNLVKEGDTVKRGQTIARVGSTGSSSGNHLHFEVRVDEQPKDPLLYLPPQ